MKFIVGKKLQMSQIFVDNGNVVPVTLVEAGPCFVSQVKTEKKDGYKAVQVGFGKSKNLSKSLKGHLKGLSDLQNLKEFRISDKEELTLEKGDIINVESFVIGDMLKVTGTSKGKGFQGVVRRYGFKGSPASHGHKDQLRMPGSIGSTGPARVFKGTRMGGQMGNQQVTVHNLELVQVDQASNLLYIKGAIPGSKNSLISITCPGELVVKKSEKQPARNASLSDAGGENKKLEDKNEEKQQTE